MSQADVATEPGFGACDNLMWHMWQAYFFKLVLKSLMGERVYFLSGLGFHDIYG
jgi:hypothetical protein